MIAGGAGIASLSMNFWVPFLPIYMLDLGAVSDANALVWVGLATSAQGVARLVSGPVWGALSDRVGRKLMFVRALYFATVTTMIAAFATAPWHVAVAFAFQGLFSGFVPAAVALTSVTVPDRQLSSSLGLVTGAQYLGNTLGPATGAVLAGVFGIRGAIVVAAAMPAVAATMVLFTVPRDRVAARRSKAAAADESAGAPAHGRSIFRLVTPQFYLALFIYFTLFSMSQLVRLTAPLSLSELAGEESTGAVGAAFTVAGVASVIGVLVVARRFVRPGGFRRAFVVGSLAAAAAQVVLAAAPSVPVYVAAFAAVSLTQAAMLPASNTLIASAVPAARRGTAFGIAGSTQAVAFMVGPMFAALFAATSMRAGLLALGVVFVGLAALARGRLREPDLG